MMEYHHDITVWCTTLSFFFKLISESPFEFHRTITNSTRLPMQSPGVKLFNRSRRERTPSTRHGLPANYDLPETSSYTEQPGKFNQNKLPRINSIKAAAREVTSAFTICFIPKKHKSTKGAIHEDDLYPVNGISFSTKESTGSNNESLRKFKYFGSRGSNSAKQEVMKFSIAEIYKATGNFSLANRIGQGGFGAVYKGKLKDGSLVAVKRAKKNMYERHLAVEFKTEIQTLSKVEHLNLVRFLGYLEHDDERIIVVEYVGNGTLREHLDGIHKDGLELAERLDIAIDVAHAVTYLHMYTDHPIIHGDIKASNILITEKLRAKVADFGFAHLCADDPDATHISTQIKGTTGYLDPEYLRTYQLTEKSDIYSFGVLLIELVTGRRPIEPKEDLKERVTTRWAIQRFNEGNAILAMDPRLRRNAAANLAIEKVLELASQCLAPSRRSRPSMKKCAEILWGIRKDYRDIELSSRLSGKNFEREATSSSINY